MGGVALATAGLVPGVNVSGLDVFEVSWRVGAGEYRFSSPRSVFTLPDGAELALPLAAWAGLREVLRLLPVAPGEASEASVPLPSGKPTPTNRGKAWLPEEEERCAAAWTSGDEPAEIAVALGRSRGAVLARLVKLGLLEEGEAELRFPVAKGGEPAG